MNRSLRSFSILALSLLLWSDIAWAQGTAQLNGRVSDPSGAVLAGVTVTATQTDTGFTRTVVTDESGAWVIEAFNLFNNFNWGDPNTSLDAGTFGRITTQTGDPRIMQFAVKFGF